MKVSVVIPTFNRGYIIADAITSVLDQSYKEFEILVVDDGSLDDTHNVIDRFADRGLIYLRHDKNRGCSAAYNTGLSAASGSFVAFLDSDDIWKPSYLKRQIDFLSRHPELDAVFTDTEIQGANLRIPSLIGLMKRFPNLLVKQQGKSEYIFTSREMYLCLLEEIPVKPSALVFKKDLYTKFGGFNEKWPSGTDWDLILRFSRSACFGYINQPLVIQRRTPDPTHQIFKESDKLFLISVFTHEKAMLHGDREALGAVNRGLLFNYNDLGHHYRESGERTKAIATYLKGFKETREPALALRAAYSCLPRTMMNFARRAIRGSR
jgi:glycosyltransferase involved in cell wall biosynthesis